MKILALETSTEDCSVALWQDGSVHARCERVGQKHSEVLLTMVDAVLRAAHCRLNEVDGIAYGKGPGSFTGVRIACGAAQGLALGADVPVVGVCTLQALAQASGRNKVIAALDARMGELYLAAYVQQQGAWATLQAPQLCTLAEAAAPEGDDWYGCGSGFGVQDGALAQRLQAQLSEVDAQAMPHANAVAQLAAVEFAQGRVMDAALALPLYLRDRVALTTRERQAAAGGMQA